MRKLSKRERFFVFGIGGLGILLLSDVFLFSPISKRSGNLNQEVLKAELTLKKSFELEARKEGILQEYKNIEKYLELIGTDEELIASFLKEIEISARQANISIIELKPRTQIQKKSGYSKYSIDLCAEGSMKAIIDFIYKLETSKFLLKARSLSLSSEDKKTDLLKADIKVVGIVVYK